MTIERCKSATKVTKVKVEERGRKATFLNEGKQQFYRTQVDGCLVCNALAADWIVSKEGAGDIIIELKGKDVAHGVDQILATAGLWTKLNQRNGRISGLIVATRYPRIDTTIQKAKEEFAKKFRGPLHIVNSNCEYQFERVLAFEGPR